jgi:hypothetical protein
VNVAQWLSLAVIVVACGGLALLIRGYRHDIAALVADIDGEGDYPGLIEQVANLTADVAEQQLLLQQTRTRMTQLANHVVGVEQPSSGRHARVELEAA